MRRTILGAITAVAITLVAHGVAVAAAPDVGIAPSEAMTATSISPSSTTTA